MRRKLSKFPGEAIQHLGLLIAFVLLVAAHEFAATHPALTAILVFVFSLPYLGASVVTRRANFLYATMLLGAVSYFLACHALGMPGASFPLLSVPLVICLWVVGRYLGKRLPAELASFAPTVFRAMNITVGVFSVWALIQAGDLMGLPGLLRYVAAFTFLAYAGLYLAHCVCGAPAIYTYVFCGFLTLGGIFTVAALESVEFCWIAIMASAAVILFMGTKLHRDRGYRWSRHCYFSSGVVILISLVFSLLRWPFLLVDLATGSLLLWAAYTWLNGAVDNVRTASMAERTLAKCFFYCALLMTAPIAPAIFIWPGNLYVAVAGLVCTATFLRIAWARRDQVVSGTWNVYVLAAAMFGSQGLIGIGTKLPVWWASAWSVIIPLVLLGGLGLAYAFFKRRNQGNPADLTAAIFPVFFAWFIPLLQGQLTVALIAVAATIPALIILNARLKERSLYYAAGPAAAGLVALIVLLFIGQGMTAWIVCAVGAAGAAAWFVWAGDKDREVTRGATNLGWLILSATAITIAGAAGISHLLYCVVGTAFISVLIAGRRKYSHKQDVFEFLARVLAILTTIAAVALGPFSGAGATVAGLCLLVLSLSYWVGWGQNRELAYVRVGIGLLALGLLLAIFGAFTAVEIRLGAGLVVVLVLFALAAVMRHRFPRPSSSAALVGHLSGIVLGCTALIQAWPLSRSYVALVAAPYVVLYALMPRLRKNAGLRLGAALWLSLVVMFSLALYAHTPYRAQVHLMAIVSVMWLIAGYVLSRVKATAWSMPFYVCAAVLSGFCGIVSLFAPAAEGSWAVFLLNGIVFSGLFLILRQDVFAYLITVSLSLLAYNWAKASTSVFTQDVLFYLVIGAAVLGVLFALPYLKRLLGRTGSLPIFSIFTRRGVLLLSGVVVGFTLLVISAYSLKLTGHPRFCTMCHNMEDYYNSWQHSSHQEVACIQCHYDPGLASTVKGKLAGLVQVVKYVSHSYTSNPQALISNESCMREGCHSDMDQNKESLLFKGRIAFLHNKHLNGHPRGKELNCVSCHGQTVEGQHIGVTETTCLTCHFYGRKAEPVMAGGCLTCHQVPAETVAFMGQSFDHRKFLQGKEAVRCSHCHSQVTQGDGAVSSTRCRSCHTSKLAKIEDQAQFHLVHVSKGHFDCLQCHDEIKHGIRPMEQQLLASGNCKTCHEGERHSLQERIYAGKALPELQTMPDVMYKAGVACEGCHTDVRLSGFSAMPFTKKRSGTKQCADCHGNKRYGEMLTAWQEETRERIGELTAVLEQLERTCKSSQAPAEELARARKLLTLVRKRLSCVVEDGSYGAHNFDYVSAILDSADEEIENCQSLAARWGVAHVQESKK